MECIKISTRWINFFKACFILSCLFSLFPFHFELKGENQGKRDKNTTYSQEKVAASGETPNFIIIYCDNLVCGDIDPFGSRLIRIPELNRMAK